MNSGGGMSRIYVWHEDIIMFSGTFFTDGSWSTSFDLMNMIRDSRKPWLRTFGEKRKNGWASYCMQFTTAVFPLASHKNASLCLSMQHIHEKARPET